MKWIKNNYILLIIGALVVFSLFWDLLISDLFKPSIETTPFHSAEVDSSIDTQQLPIEINQSTTQEKLYVDVKGAIYKPGVYLVEPDDRVIDVIESAGGFTDDADENQINLAEKVYDAMVIYVPSVSDYGELIVQSQSNDGKIRINQATQTELEQLPGIGATKALAIIQYREDNGPFKTAEELQNVSGIGAKTFEQIKEFIIVP